MRIVEPNEPNGLFVLYIVLMLGMILFFISGCTTTKYVPVDNINYQRVFRHDTVVTHDTLEHNTTTVVHEIDSLQMAKYGITLASKEKAWLIEKAELNRQISLQHSVHSDTVMDSVKVSVPYFVKRELSKWEQFKSDSFIYILVLFIVFALLIFIYTVRTLIKKFKFTN